MEYLSAEYYHVSFWPNESVEVVHWFIVVAVFEAATTAEGVNLISPDQDVCCVHPRFIQAHHRTGKAWKQRWHMLCFAATALERSPLYGFSDYRLSLCCLRSNAGVIPNLSR